jgi:hypothetical protein
LSPGSLLHPRNLGSLKVEAAENPELERAKRILKVATHALRGEEKKVLEAETICHSLAIVYQT